MTTTNSLSKKTKTLNLPAKTLSSLLLVEMNKLKSEIEGKAYLKISKNLDEKEFAYFMEEVYEEVIEKIKLKISSANVNRKIKFLQEQ